MLLVNEKYVNVWKAFLGVSLADAVDFMVELIWSWCTTVRQFYLTLHYGSFRLQLP